MTAALASVRLGKPWRTTVETRHRAWVRLRIDGPHGARAGIVLQRCTAGPLGDAYPVAEHDVEVQVVGTADLTAVLRGLVSAVEAADPGCRRVVFAAAIGDLAAVEAAETAGFRYVLDVDLPSSAPGSGVDSRSLLVAEPGWVTHIDEDTAAITAPPGERLTCGSSRTY